MKVELSKSQCINVAEFIEAYLIQSIRDDSYMDNIEYLRDMIDAERALREAAEADKGGC